MGAVGGYTIVSGRRRERHKFQHFAWLHYQTARMRAMKISARSQFFHVLAGTSLSDVGGGVANGEARVAVLAGLHWLLTGILVMEISARLLFYQLLAGTPFFNECGKVANGKA